jgi:hypothetical protein
VFEIFIHARAMHMNTADAKKPLYYRALRNVGEVRSTIASASRATRRRVASMHCDVVARGVRTCGVHTSLSGVAVFFVVL